jgi:hypothetical protein
MSYQLFLIINSKKLFLIIGEGLGTNNKKNPCMLVSVLK